MIRIIAIAAVVIAREVAAPWAGWARLLLGGLAILLVVWSLRRRDADEDDLRKVR